MKTKPKVIAIYLPQYHNVKENNEWWGNGFTDWKAMDSAKPLYEGHMQPKKPLNNYQYDLLEKETILWQTALAKRYNIYGFAYYHYWFKDGKKILEKPIEKLLEWKDIDMPFCFYWANESWVRSWSNINNQNTWASLFEPKGKNINRSNSILLEQGYGNKKDWEEHFFYMLPFFKDCRYIKINNKPIFMIYKPEFISCLKEMLECWKKLAKEHDFSGMYIIGANSNDSCMSVLDAELSHEPAATLQRCFPQKFNNRDRTEVARYLSYENVWSELLKFNKKSKKIYWSGFSNFDTTPRYGNAGTVIFNGTCEKFKIYLTELYAKSAASNNEFLFINAWNEWGEGMYLEPDENEKFGYLEAFGYAQTHYKEEIYKYLETKKSVQETNSLQFERNRYYLETRVLDEWLRLKEKGISIAEYLSEMSYRRIAIYGFGLLGRHLLEELKESILIKNLFVIDRNSKGINLNIPVFSPGEDLPDCDLVIVTTIHIYEQICKDLSPKKYKILSLKQVISECIEKST